MRNILSLQDKCQQGRWCPLYCIQGWGIEQWRIRIAVLNDQIVIKSNVIFTENLLPPLLISVPFLKLNMLETAKAKIIKRFFMFPLLVSGLDWDNSKVVTHNIAKSQNATCAKMQKVSESLIIAV